MSDCTCPKCKDCCWRSPGWFATIEEVKGAAAIMGLSLEDFCKEYLIREYWAGPDEHVSIPAPRKDFSRVDPDKEVLETKMSIWASFFGETDDILPTNEEAKLNGKGFVKASFGHNLLSGIACIFLTEDEACSINDSKPNECRMSFGCKKNTESYREPCVAYWKDKQHLLPIEED